MDRPIRACVDASVAVLLAAVLLVVYWIDQRGSSAKVYDSNSGAGAGLKAETPAAVPLKLAVTPAGFDDMGKLLATLGEGYRYEVIDESKLLDPAALPRFDAIFLTCAEAEGPGARRAPRPGAGAQGVCVQRGHALRIRPAVRHPGRRVPRVCRRRGRRPGGAAKPARRGRLTRIARAPGPRNAAPFRPRRLAACGLRRRRRDGVPQGQFPHHGRGDDRCAPPRQIPRRQWDRAVHLVPQRETK